MGHGTKSFLGQQQFLEIIYHAQHHFRLPVSGGFIELAEPNMDSAIKTFIEAEGLDRLIIVPMVLFPAGHMKDDGPHLAHLAQRYGGENLKVIYASHLGLLPEIITVVGERIVESLSTDPNPADPSAILLVGRGSTDPDGNAEMYKAMRLLAEQSYSDFSAIQPAFVSLTSPSVDQGLDILYRLGYSKILVQPFFLFHGILIDRMFLQAQSWASSFNSAPIILTSKEIGPHKLLLDAIEFRLLDALGDVVRTSCDLCIYRTRGLGQFEPKDN